MNKRLTVGFLIDFFTDDYQAEILKGIVNETEKQDSNILRSYFIDVSFRKLSDFNVICNRAQPHDGISGSKEIKGTGIYVRVSQPERALGTENIKGRKKISKR